MAGYELLIQNRAGTTRDYGSCATEINYTTNRTGSPGKLTGTLIVDGSFNVEMGNAVRFSVSGQAIFAGFIFKYVQQRDGVIDFVAYDQLRYLKTNESYLFVGKKLGEIITQIANDFQLSVGIVEDTGYAIPYLLQEDKGCLDIISYALQLTTINTNKIYVFFDDAGKLSLRLAGNMLTDIVIGSGSLLTEYSFSVDIDKESYNRIKLVRPNQETGRTDVYIYQDSSTINNWGTLQLYQQVDEEFNEAQITQQGEMMLDYYNRELKTLQVSGIGVLGLRAGSMCMININEVGKTSLSSFMLIDKISHNFTQNDHTMDLEIRTII